MVHAHNSSTRKGEAVGLRVPDLPGLYNKTLEKLNPTKPNCYPKYGTQTTAWVPHFKLLRNA